VSCEGPEGISGVRRLQHSNPGTRADLWVFLVRQLRHDLSEKWGVVRAGREALVPGTVQPAVSSARGGCARSRRRTARAPAVGQPCKCVSVIAHDRRHVRGYCMPRISRRYRITPAWRRRGVTPVYRRTAARKPGPISGVSLYGSCAMTHLHLFLQRVHAGCAWFVSAALPKMLRALAPRVVMRAVCARAGGGPALPVRARCVPPPEAPARAQYTRGSPRIAQHQHGGAGEGGVLPCPPRAPGEHGRSLGVFSTAAAP
jgi:hypothetical protein